MVAGRTFRALQGLLPLCLILGTLLLTPPPVAGQGGPESRVYRLKHGLVQDFEPMVRALLSKRGKLTVSPDLRLLIVNDQPAQLATIDSLLAVHDRPRQQFKISIQLIMGSNADDPVPLPEDLAHLLPLIEEENYEFNVYEVVDQGVILADDGATTTLSLAGNRYAIAFQLTAILEPTRAARFLGFSLNENQRSLRGTTAREIISTRFSVRNGLSELVTASKQGAAGKTLLVFINAVFL